MKLRVFKPLERRTASIEVYEDDEEQTVAEVFAREGGQRRFYLSEWALRRGLDWSDFAAMVPRITALLDEADAEMQETQKFLDDD